MTYKERKKILAEIEEAYLKFDNEKSYKARKSILAEIEELYLVFDGKKKLTKEDSKTIKSLKKIKSLLLKEDATEKEFKSLLHDVEYVEEHESEVEGSELLLEVFELLDADKVSMDSLFSTSA